MSSLITFHQGSLFSRNDSLIPNSDFYMKPLKSADSLFQGSHDDWRDDENWSWQEHPGQGRLLQSLRSEVKDQRPEVRINNVQDKKYYVLIMS